ncbi:MAG: hypothetical protein ROO73_02940 [Roseivirga sp.]
MTAALLGLPLSFLLRAWLIAPNMHRFEGCLTLGEMMGKLYGGHAQTLAGLLGLCSAVTAAGLQLSALGLIAQHCLGLNPALAILGGGLLLAAYTAWGGIKAVTATDVIQFLVLIVVLPIIALLLLHEAGGTAQMLASVPAEKWHIFSHERFTYYLTFFLLWGLFFNEMLFPPMMQRLLMARGTQQLRVSRPKID